MKILFLDIETTPHLSWHWGLYNQNISPVQVVQRSRLLCFAAKFLDGKIQFYSEWDHGHEGMVQAVHHLLNEADVVVAYNGDAFDVKKINAEFARYKMTPPSPYQTIDLLKVVRKNFKFFNNKFDSVLSELSLEGKVQHRGFSLWPACMHGDKRAQKEMKRYCIGDVYPSLEQTYMELRPWISNHPNVNLFTGTQDSCPNCGGCNLQSRGYLYKTVGKYRRYQCQDCGRWSSSGRREVGADLR